MRALLKACLPVALVLALAVFPRPDSAEADSAGEAREAATKAAAEVSSLQLRTRAALRAYESSAATASERDAQTGEAESAAATARSRSSEARQVLSRRVRGLYMSGGATGLYASVLTTGSADDALRQLAYVQHIVAAADEAATSAAERAAGSREAFALAEDRAQKQAQAAARANAQYAELVELLAEAQASLGRLSKQARELEAAAAAEKQLQELAAAVTATGSTRVADARAGAVPPAYLALYRRAARTCPGLSWTVVAAIGQVETGHGRNKDTSYAGAQGPMQFMPATFAAYGVDGGKDGRIDITDPADAVFSAANYLCANGAGRDEPSLARAIWHYNHAEWYVQLVLKLAGQLSAQRS